MTGRHLPSSVLLLFLALLHALHAPEQAFSQQTASTQNPDRHWEPSVQPVLPLVF
jgi:hypothetical protein